MLMLRSRLPDLFLRVVGSFGDQLHACERLLVEGEGRGAIAHPKIKANGFPSEIQNSSHRRRHWATFVYIDQIAPPRA